MKTRIFVVNNGGHRYDLALDVVPDASIVFMTSGNVNPTQVDRLVFNLNNHVARSTEADYLLLSGSPILNALAAMLWILQHKVCNFLIFDAKTQSYVRQIVHRDNLTSLLHNEQFGSVKGSGPERGTY